MKLFIMLQDKGYQDPTYKLFYYAEKDALVGFYYHAAMDKTFEVIFYGKNRNYRCLPSVTYDFSPAASAVVVP
jgi:hypothetical protein